MAATLKLPAMFIHDRLDRDMPCGEVSFSGKRATVDCDAETLADIRDDADYQADWTDNEDLSLRRSARRTRDLIDEFYSSEAAS